MRANALEHYNSLKDTFSTDGDTPDDTSDDVHGALYHRQNKVWRAGKTLRDNHINIYMFLAGMYFEKNQSFIAWWFIKQGIENSFTTIWDEQE